MGQLIKGTYFMLSERTRSKALEIINRLAIGTEVTLEERFYLKGLADRDQTVSNWVKRAKRSQIQPEDINGIDKLLTNLDLGSPDPQSVYNPTVDDLGDWFSGAPKWVRRS